MCGANVTVIVRRIHLKAERRQVVGVAQPVERHSDARHDVRHGHHLLHQKIFVDRHSVSWYLPIGDDPHARPVLIRTRRWRRLRRQIACGLRDCKGHGGLHDGAVGDLCLVHHRTRDQCHRDDQRSAEEGCHSPAHSEVPPKVHAGWLLSHTRRMSGHRAVGA